MKRVFTFVELASPIIDPFIADLAEPNAPPPIT